MTSLRSRALAVLAILVAGSAASEADVVLDWNEIAVSVLPASETRIVAIAQLAAFEAVNAVTREYQPYLGTIDAPPGTSPEAAAVAAAHAVLRHYVPDRATDLDAARERSLATILDGPAKKAGIAVGESAADAMIALRAADGSAPPEFYQPSSSDPGDWQLTPGCTGGVLFNLRNVTPFGIRRGSQFRLDPPPRLNSWQYAVAYYEVKRVGAMHSVARPQDRADVARFYATVLSTGTWNPIARQLAQARSGSLTQNARTLALLNMAMYDALIGIFDTKYHAPFWRPETAIRAGDTDGNRATRGDPGFTPFIPTPCHPSYPSAHAGASNAARTVLERIYGRAGHLIELSSPAVPGVSLQYTRLDQVTSDIDDARIYGGIHFRFDQEAGTRLGRKVGAYVYRHHLCSREDAHRSKRDRHCHQRSSGCSTTCDWQR